jgi:prepilin-type N-terminal cleavage/methylation domain-containing protein
MMQKRAFTLLEMIFVVVISGILAMGTFKAMEALYIRSAKAKAVTELSLQSQIVLDQIGVMLYNRVPNSVIGSSSGFSTCEPISESTISHTTLQWLGTMDDELLEQKYDGFIDMAGSDKSTKTLDTPNITLADNDDINLIFSGAFDDGTNSIKACNGAFGFNGGASDLAFDIIINSADDNITITDATQPDYIYEKYYLTDTAYAITRGEDLTQSDLEANCNNGTFEFPSDMNFTNTLFLFYDFKPYKGETFCGDSS